MTTYFFFRTNLISPQVLMTGFWNLLGGKWKIGGRELKRTTMIRLCHFVNKLPSSQNGCLRLSGRDSSSIGIRENLRYVIVFQLSTTNFYCWVNSLYFYLSDLVKKIRPIGQKRRWCKSRVKQVMLKFVKSKR